MGQPAPMEAGLTTHVWTFEELVSLLEYKNSEDRLIHVYLFRDTMLKLISSENLEYKDLVRDAA